jgi:hypothetical protein
MYLPSGSPPTEIAAVRTVKWLRGVALKLTKPCCTLQTVSDEVKRHVRDFAGAELQRCSIKVVRTPQMQCQVCLPNSCRVCTTHVYRYSARHCLILAEMARAAVQAQAKRQSCMSCRWPGWLYASLAL